MHGLTSCDSTNYGFDIPRNLVLYNGIEVLVGKINRVICKPTVISQDCSYHHEHGSSISYGHSIPLACGAFACTLCSYNGIEELEHQFPAEVVHVVSYNTLHDTSDNHFGTIDCIFDIAGLVYFYSV